MIHADSTDPPAGTLSVVGTGSVTTTPDSARLSAGVTTDGATASEAMDANAKAMAKVIAGAEGRGDRIEGPADRVRVRQPALRRRRAEDHGLQRLELGVRARARPLRRRRRDRRRGRRRRQQRQRPVARARRPGQALPRRAREGRRERAGEGSCARPSRRRLARLRAVAEREPGEPRADRLRRRDEGCWTPGRRSSPAPPRSRRASASSSGSTSPAGLQRPVCAVSRPESTAPANAS